MKGSSPGFSLSGLIIAEFLSLIASQVSSFVLPLIVLEQTKSTIITSAVLFGNYLPFVIAAFLGGRLIYIFGARQVSISADLVAFVSMICLAVAFNVLGVTLPYALLLSLVLLGALLHPIGIAARHTIVYSLIMSANKSVGKMNSIRGSLEHAADLIGPLIGIVLIRFVSVVNVLAATAVLFFCSSAISFFTIPVNASQNEKSSSAGFKKGVRFIFRHQSLRVFAILGMISSFIISSFLGLLLLLLSIKVYHNAGLLAISLSIFSLSATISAWQFANLKRRFSHTTIYYASVLILGAGIIVAGIATMKYGVLLSCGLAGLAGASNPLEQTVVQQETPTPLTGQVFSLLLSVRFASGAIGLLSAGIAAKFYPVKELCIFGGSLLVIAVALWWRFAPLKN